MAEKPQKLRLLADLYDQPQSDDRDADTVRYRKGDLFQPRSEREARHLVEQGAALDPQAAQERRERELQAERDRLEAQRAALDAELDGLATRSEDLSSLSKADLQARADEAGLDVQGTGRDGSVTKDDLVDALQAHQASQG